MASNPFSIEKIPSMDPVEKLEFSDGMRGSDHSTKNEAGIEEGIFSKAKESPMSLSMDCMNRITRLENGWGS